MIYDSVSYALKTKSGLLNTMMTMGSYYASYITYYATPYVALNFYGAAGLATIMTLINTGKFLDKS